MYMYIYIHTSWMVVSNIFYVHPYLGKIPSLTNIFQMGWNHQLASICSIKRSGLLRTRQRGLHSMGPNGWVVYGDPDLCFHFRCATEPGEGLGDEVIETCMMTFKWIPPKKGRVQMRAESTSALEPQIYRKRIGLDYGQISAFHNRFQQIRD